MTLISEYTGSRWACLPHGWTRERTKSRVRFYSVFKVPTFWGLLSWPLRDVGLGVGVSTLWSALHRRFRGLWNLMRISLELAFSCVLQGAAPDWDYESSMVLGLIPLTFRMYWIEAQGALPRAWITFLSYLICCEGLAFGAGSVLLMICCSLFWVALCGIGGFRWGHRYCIGSQASASLTIFANPVVSVV